MLNSNDISGSSKILNYYSSARLPLPHYSTRNVIKDGVLENRSNLENDQACNHNGEQNGERLPVQQSTRRDYNERILFQINENYQTIATKQDSLTEFMFPSTAENRGAKLNASVGASQKWNVENQENILLGPWCEQGYAHGFGKKDDFQSTEPKNQQSEPLISYLDPYITSVSQSSEENPRTKWCLPDTNIYLPNQALVWPPSVKQESILQE